MVWMWGYMLLVHVFLFGLYLYIKQLIHSIQVSAVKLSRFEFPSPLLLFPFYLLLLNGG